MTLQQRLVHRCLTLRPSFEARRAGRPHNKTAAALLGQEHVRADKNAGPAFEVTGPIPEQAAPTHNERLFIGQKVDDRAG